MHLCNCSKRLNSAALAQLHQKTRQYSTVQCTFLWVRKAEDIAKHAKLFKQRRHGTEIFQHLSHLTLGPDWLTDSTLKHGLPAKTAHRAKRKTASQDLCAR